MSPASFPEGNLDAASRRREGPPGGEGCVAPSPGDPPSDGKRNFHPSLFVRYVPGFLHIVGDVLREPLREDEAGAKVDPLVEIDPAAATRRVVGRAQEEVADVHPALTDLHRPPELVEPAVAGLEDL